MSLCHMIQLNRCKVLVPTAVCAASLPSATQMVPNHHRSLELGSRTRLLSAMKLYCLGSRFARLHALRRLGAHDGPPAKVVQFSTRLLGNIVRLSLVAAAIAARAADFAAPPSPFQTVPRPSDGEILSANPPCFVFPARRIFDSYIVEFGPDARFPAGTTTRIASPYMLAVAPEQLKPNRYFWRWRPGRLDDDAAGGWSPVCSFVVPADIPVVPFPDIDTLGKRIGVSRPRVLVRATEVAEFRHRALEIFGQGWLAGVRKFSEQMRGKALLPEPAFLPPTSDSRRKILYLETFQTTRPFFKDLRVLAENYLLTGDEMSGQEAKRRLLHIIAWEIGRAHV